MTEGTARMAGPDAAGEKTDRNLVVEAPGRVAVRDEPRAPVPPGGFRVTTVFSGVSAGTELSYIKGTNPFLSQCWDQDLGLFVPGEPDAGYPVADLVVPLPEDLDPLLGIYVAHMGPICANGLLHAAADLCGPSVRSLGDGVRGGESPWSAPG